MAAPRAHAQVVHALYRSALRLARIVEKRPTLWVLMTLKGPNFRSFVGHKERLQQLLPQDFFQGNAINGVKRGFRSASRHPVWDSEAAQADLSLGFLAVAVMSQAVQLGRECGYLQAPPIPEQPDPPSPFFAYAQHVASPADNGRPQPFAIDTACVRRMWRATELVLSCHEPFAHLASVGQSPSSPLRVPEEVFDPAQGVVPYLLALHRVVVPQLPKEVAAAFEYAIAIVSDVARNPRGTPGITRLRKHDFDESLYDDDCVLDLDSSDPVRAALHPAVDQWEELPSIPAPVPLTREACLSAVALFEQAEDLQDPVFSGACAFQSAQAVPTSEAYRTRGFLRLLASHGFRRGGDLKRLVLTLSDVHVAMILAPYEARPLCTMAMALHTRENDEQVLQLLDLALECPGRTSHGYAHFTKGTILSEQGRHEQALYHFLLGTECSPSSSTAAGCLRAALQMREAES